MSRLWACLKKATAFDGARRLPARIAPSRANALLCGAQFAQIAARLLPAPPRPTAPEGGPGAWSPLAVFRNARPGLTLVELLVVITILVLLTGVVIPVLTPSLESRRMREAARQVNLYLNRARSMAMERKRPVGVWLQRHTQNNQAVTTLFLLEQSVPVGVICSTGNNLTPRIVVQNPAASGPGTGTATIGFVGGTASGVEVGDYLQLNFQGPIWEITRISGSVWTFRQVGMGPPVPPVSPSTGVPFQIFRTPRFRSLASPLDLPAGTAIDTQWSGIGTGTLAQAFAPLSGTDTNPLLIIFSPKGEVESVWCSGGQGSTWQRNKLIEPIYLLVGKFKRIPQGEDGLTNWQDLGNLWVVVTPQTGMVRTVEMASGANVIESRRIAREGQSMGGK